MPLNLTLKDCASTNTDSLFESLLQQYDEQTITNGIKAIPKREGYAAGANPIAAAEEQKAIKDFEEKFNQYCENPDNKEILTNAATTRKNAQDAAQLKEQAAQKAREIAATEADKALKAQKIQSARKQIMNFTTQLQTARPQDLFAKIDRYTNEGILSRKAIYNVGEEPTDENQQTKIQLINHIIKHVPETLANVKAYNIAHPDQKDGTPQWDPQNQAMWTPKENLPPKPVVPSEVLSDLMSQYSKIAPPASDQKESLALYQNMITAFYPDASTRPAAITSALDAIQRTGNSPDAQQIAEAQKFIAKVPQEIQENAKQAVDNIYKAICDKDNWKVFVGETVLLPASDAKKHSKTVPKIIALIVEAIDKAKAQDPGTTDWKAIKDNIDTILENAKAQNWLSKQTRSQDTTAFYDTLRDISKQKPQAQVTSTSHDKGEAAQIESKKPAAKTSLSQGTDTQKTDLTRTAIEATRESRARLEAQKTEVENQKTPLKDEGPTPKGP